MKIPPTLLKFIIFPVLGTVYRFTAPLIGNFMPLNKEIVYVHHLNDTINTETQYPVLDFIGLVERHGYTAEEHVVTTTDGYILKLHRISGSPLSPKGPGKPVVFLQHGIILSSDSWVLIGPEKDLAFLLADAGKDVWIGNVRGNYYAKSHLSKNPKKVDFWTFSYHEMAIYDVRGMIDHILNETRQEKLTYYGYSMGTTLSYVLLSVFPEYNEKIEKLHSCMPVVFWKHGLKPQMQLLDDSWAQIEELISHYNLFEVMPHSALLAYIGENFCGDQHVNSQPICVSVFSKIGLDPERLNKTALPSIMAHFPAGTSINTVYHYNQNFKNGSFQSYNYGREENEKRYAQPLPLVYNLTKVTAPVSLWYGKNDDIVNFKDVLELKDSLPNVETAYEVASVKFNHFDFLWAKDVKELLYDKMMQTN